MNKQKKCFNLPFLCVVAMAACSMSLHADPLTVDAEDVTITRGDSASLTCTGTGGCPPYTYEWSSWTKGNGSAKKTGQTVSAKILESCSVTVTVKDSATPPETNTKTVAVTVEAREWNVVHTTDPDAWSNWGSFPFGLVGLNVNANNNSSVPIIGETGGNWDDQITKTQITDSNGPFDQYWYNSTHSLRVERETKINQYLKGQVAGASFNWVTLQNNLAANPGSNTPALTATAVRNGVAAHENQGNVAANFNSNPKQGGHSTLFKAKQDSGPENNAAKEVEPLYDASSKDTLQDTNDDKVGTVDARLGAASQDPLTGNLDSYVVVDYNTSTQTPVINHETQ